MNKLPLILASLAIAAAQSIVTNLDTANWTQEKGGSASVVLREDPATGGMELLARYPAGHVIAPHWHESNERLIVLEGQLNLGDAVLKEGAFAYLPAREVQRISCTSKTRCTFYLSWDGKPNSHPAK